MLEVIVRHVDDNVVDELTLAPCKQPSEVCLEVVEEIVDQLVLQLWRELLVEIKFFDHKVEVPAEGLE